MTPAGPAISHLWLQLRGRNAPLPERIPVNPQGAWLPWGHYNTAPQNMVSLFFTFRKKFCFFNSSFTRQKIPASPPCRRQPLPPPVPEPGAAWQNRKPGSGQRVFTDPRAAPPAETLRPGAGNTPGHAGTAAARGNGIPLPGGEALPSLRRLRKPPGEPLPAPIYPEAQSAAGKTPSDDALFPGGLQDPQTQLPGVPYRPGAP